MRVRFADLWGNFRAAEALPLVVKLTIGWRERSNTRFHGTLPHEHKASAGAGRLRLLFG